MKKAEKNKDNNLDRFWFKNYKVGNDNVKDLQNSFFQKC